MRGFYHIGSRYASNRAFYFVIGSFVCIQMYGMFLNESTLGVTKSETQSPVGSIRETITRNPEITTVNSTVLKGLFPDLLKLNTEQTIRNLDKFPLKIGPDTVVLLVQVHKRTEDLKIMIESMKYVTYINESLLVFSHDFYSPDIFDVIRAIDFCPVLQLFYPFSIQFHADSFPGSPKNDCARNTKKEEALKSGCYNAKFPDAFGHYREGHFTQIKHHWLWKQHFVFDRLRVLKNFSGTVLRLDDDYYLSQDIIHVIRTLDRAKSEACPTCLMYILGEHEKLKPQTYASQTGEAETLIYYTGVGRGMAFKKEFWDLFKSCASSFCEYDDYNWDFALQNSAVSCMKKFPILKPRAGRVFHIGTCKGVHRNIRNCNKNKVKTDIVATLTKYENKLFPKTFKIFPGKYKSKPNPKFKKGVGNGGWADPRDVKLCYKIFYNETQGEKTLVEINKSISLL